MFINSEQIQQLIQPKDLVDKLQQAFASEISTPVRQHFDIPNPSCERETTLLLMPSWQVGADIGVKLVTVVPEADKFNLPSIQGSYVLMDAVKGGVKSIIDVPTLTAKRTAAASALASRFLSRHDSEILCMVGTGTLAPELIIAHCAVRPISQVMEWGRDLSKAKAVIEKVAAKLPNVCFSAAEELEQAVKGADIVSCATMSMTPLIFGDWLSPGQHIDLVGAYRPDMREADDAVIQKAKWFVYNLDTACKETGDLVIPIANGLITPNDVHADLFALCRGEAVFERNRQDITVFKSVGHALEDLAAAQLIMEQLNAK